MQAASRRSIVVTEPPEAHHIDGRRTGLVTSPARAADPSRRRLRPLQRSRENPVTTLKLHYDGWLALPAALRRELGLDKGAALEIELVDGTIVLRPSDEGRGSAVGRGREATEAPVALASSAPPSPRADTPAAREGDRARKDPDPTPPDQASRPKRPRGRPREAEVEPGPAPLPVPAPLWELRRKADRPVVAAGGDDPAPVPDRRPVRLARERVHGHEPEERRPFRNVEVRKLGPRRGHDRPRASRSRLQLPGQRRG